MWTMHFPYTASLGGIQALLLVRSYSLNDRTGFWICIGIMKVRESKIAAIYCSITALRHTLKIKNPKILHIIVSKTFTSQTFAVCKLAGMQRLLGREMSLNFE